MWVMMLHNTAHPTLNRQEVRLLTRKTFGFQAKNCIHFKLNILMVDLIVNIVKTWKTTWTKIWLREDSLVLYCIMSPAWPWGRSCRCCRRPTWSRTSWPSSQWPWGSPTHRPPLSPCREPGRLSTTWPRHSIIFFILWRVNLQSRLINMFLTFSISSPNPFLACTTHALIFHTDNNSFYSPNYWHILCAWWLLFCPIRDFSAETDTCRLSCPQQWHWYSWKWWWWWW